ncbi:TPA: histidine phosphatase family protein [Candidatus Micrarchaeota archaeon]|nr:MAG: hypothetical protein AUJ65_00265 [Candidatus Micrarchaeota archaeon CG1_02_51_15]HII39450.1 histidine phosphatase family protein [Candidatus Micrarchaeota archaeon]
MKLVLIRHAESLDNAEQKTVGTGGRGLSERGKRQAKALAHELRWHRIRFVYSSPLKRAMETAQAIGKPVKEALHMQEVNLGRLEGLAHEEMKTRFPGAIERMFVEPHYRLPGGETLLEVHDRAMPFLNALKKRHENQTVAVVAHNVVNRVAIASLLGLPLRHCRNVKQKNAAYSVFYLKKNENRLYTINNETHFVK